MTYEPINGGIRNWSACLPEIERCRAEMHRIVDDSFNNLLLTLAEVEHSGSRLLPLAASPAIFKGTKPELVILPDRSRVAVRSWKNVVSAILTDCCSDPKKKERVLELRGQVAGNFRYLISGKPDRMSVPLKICEELYVEGKFDTEALLQNITGKLLDRVGYDYHGIVIQCRASQQAVMVQKAAGPTDEAVQNHGPEMSM